MAKHIPTTTTTTKVVTYGEWLLRHRHFEHVDYEDGYTIELPFDGGTEEHHHFRVGNEDGSSALFGAMIVTTRYFNGDVTIERTEYPTRMENPLAGWIMPAGLFD